MDLADWGIKQAIYCHLDVQSDQSAQGIRCQPLRTEHLRLEHDQVIGWVLRAGYRGSLAPRVDKERNYLLGLPSSIWDSPQSIVLLG